MQLEVAPMFMRTHYGSAGVPNVLFLQRMLYPPRRPCYATNILYAVSNGILWLKNCMGRNSVYVFTRRCSEDQSSIGFENIVCRHMCNFLYTKKRSLQACMYSNTSWSAQVMLWLLWGTSAVSFGCIKKQLYNPPRAQLHSELHTSSFTMHMVTLFATETGSASCASVPANQP